MKKLFLSLVAALMAATATFAQSSLLATLSHNGAITTYYGTSALRDAYAKAVVGDIITLSSGTFTAVDIEKAITLRGAGTGFDNLTQAEPTIIQGNFTIKTGKSKLTTIEGIFSNNTVFFQNSNITFLKSRFKIIKSPGSGDSSILSFIHCRIAENLKPGNGYWSDTSVSCVNSIVIFPENTSSGKSNFEFNNCIVYRGKWANQDLYRATFKNSIFLVTTAVAMESSNLFNNTLGLYTDGTANIFSNSTNSTNTQIKGYSTVFKTFTSSYSDSETFELTDAAKAKYLGKDGTQVGIYGGNMPFDGTPTNPQITKCNVAAKTTADGKLSVDIEVQSAQ